MICERTTWYIDSCPETVVLLKEYTVARGGELLC